MFWDAVEEASFRKPRPFRVPKFIADISSLLLLFLPLPSSLSLSLFPSQANVTRDEPYFYLPETKNQNPQSCGYMLLPKCKGTSRSRLSNVDPNVDAVHSIHTPEVVQ